MNSLVTGALLVIVLSRVLGTRAELVRGNPQAGQSIYQQHCLRCHGKQLDGNGPDSHDLIVRPTNLLSQESRAKTDWGLLVTITNGALFTPMHSFRGKLSDEQMLDVLSYIEAWPRSTQ